MHSHDPLGPVHSHDHGGEHGHTHEHLDNPGEKISIYCWIFQPFVGAGKYSERDMPNYSTRNFEERGFTVGIGG